MGSTARTGSSQSVKRRDVSFLAEQFLQLESMGTPPMPAPNTTILVMRFSLFCANYMTRSAGPRRLFVGIRGLFARTGIHAKQAIKRASADKGGEQRHDADPATQFQPVLASEFERIGNQHEADDDTQSTIDCSDIGGHILSPDDQGRAFSAALMDKAAC